MSNKTLEQGKCAHKINRRGYISWHAWAETKSKKEEQIQCDKCKLWLFKEEI